MEMASLPAMPLREAKTTAMLSSMQLKMSGFTTERVTLLGLDLRTKKMRVKEMMVTLGGLGAGLVTGEGGDGCGMGREKRGRVWWRTYMAPMNSWMLTTILLCRLICSSKTHTIGTLKMMTSVMRLAIPVPSHPARGAAQ